MNSRHAPGIPCPKCGNGKTSVVDSRFIKSDQCVRRRRQCRECKFRFTTGEVYSGKIGYGKSTRDAMKQTMAVGDERDLLDDMRFIERAIDVARRRLDKRI